jgi:peptidoglycan hydrolase CwlO-like protein
MTAQVVAMSEAGIVAVVGATITATASIIAAWIAHKTRSENTNQHAENKQTMTSGLEDLARSVGEVGGKVDSLHDRIDHLDGKHDQLSEKLHRHLGADSQTEGDN